MKQVVVFLIVVFFCNHTHSQNKAYVNYLVDTLSSKYMFGRGYVNSGDKIAAGFISSEFEKNKLSFFEENYHQKFVIPINTFPGELSLVLDGHELIPGKDYVISSSSPATKGTYQIVWEKDLKTGNEKSLSKKEIKKRKKQIIITGRTSSEFKDTNPFLTAGIITLTDKHPGWHVADGYRVNDFFTLKIRKEILGPENRALTIDFRNEYIEKYTTQNVVGYIEGTEYPDSFIVFSAHYDHLGQMGAETVFPGANDNASGTAMLLDLGSYYSKPENKPKYSIVFIAFSAEEAGLYGSFYYSDNPLFPLDRIRFLINLDLVGSGSEGIKVVNGSVFEKEYKLLTAINLHYGYLKNVSKRGEAANSDHYPFYVKGVPCFFIYTLGPESSEYHTIFDTPENAPFTAYENFFRLIVSFVNSF